MSRPLPETHVPDEMEAAQRTLVQWRTAHPQATLAEIERAVDQHLSAARAALITATAEAEPAAARPCCPACGIVAQHAGTRTRRLRTAQDGTLAFTEPAWRCPACGVGLFPPD